MDDDENSDRPPWRAENALAGMAAPLQSLRELILWPFLFTKEAAAIGLKWPKGLLLHGPPGTGKTSLVHAVAKECEAHFNCLSGGSLHRSYAGESERLLREAFSEGESHAASGKPAIIFIDEIDTLCPRRDSRRQQETRVVAQLLTLMDGIKSKSGSASRVVVVAATNRVNAIDPALRRPGRFDRELSILPPNLDERFAILSLHAKDIPLHKEVDLRSIASMCNGYVGADLQALCREAAMSALQKSLKRGGLEKGHLQLVGMEEWAEAKKNVGPSIVRGTAAEVPSVSWDDIGGLQEVKKKLRQAVEWPIKHGDALARLGIRPIRGVLLHGPPGCCKTTLARAAAHAAQAPLISLSGAELYSMYVGEGESVVRETFRRARLAAPSIIFFDEVDSFASRRKAGEGQNGNNTSVAEKLLSTLLTEIDGLEQAKVIFVPPPDVEGRLEILRIHTHRTKIGSDVNLHQLAQETDCYTGAELAGLCREAGMVALRESLAAHSVFQRHFDAAKASHPTFDFFTNFRVRQFCTIEKSHTAFMMNCRAFAHLLLSMPLSVCYCIFYFIFMLTFHPVDQEWQHTERC